MPCVIHRGRRLTNASRLMCTGLPIRGERVTDRIVGGSRHRRESYAYEGDRERGARVVLHKRRGKEEDRPDIERRTGTRLHDSPYPDNYRATGMPVCNRALRIRMLRHLHHFYLTENHTFFAATDRTTTFHHFSSS